MPPSHLTENIADIKRAFDADLVEAKKTGNFDDLYLKYFSKTKGMVTQLMKMMPTLTPDEKKEFGPALNELQNNIKAQVETSKADYEKSQTSSDAIDLTFPLPPKETGMLHPTTQTIRRMNEFFRYHGFSVYEGPEIETAENNFRKLNLPEGHPATDLQDSLFVEEPNILLRTHTSSVEARLLSSHQPPIRAVVPGKCYRNETASLTNSSFFYQYQGVVVDKGITIQHLKSTLTLFHKFLFGEDIVLRFRYKYYPEVTPGMGTDIRCKFCGGAGCAVCKYRGWMEVLGSGMIHPNTLKMCGIDPSIYTGYAFGIGLDRLVMNEFGVPDIRKLYGGELAYN